MHEASEIKEVEVAAAEVEFHRVSGQLGGGARVIREEGAQRVAEASKGKSGSSATDGVPASRSIRTTGRKRRIEGGQCGLVHGGELWREETDGDIGGRAGQRLGESQEGAGCGDRGGWESAEPGQEAGPRRQAEGAPPGGGCSAIPLEPMQLAASRAPSENFYREITDARAIWTLDRPAAPTAAPPPTSPS